MQEKSPRKKYKPETVRLAFSEWFVGEESADGEQRSFCPVCEDPETSKSPSASFNPELGVWNCAKSNHGSSIYELSRQLKEERGWDIRRASMRGRHKDEEYHDKIQTALGTAGRRTAPLPSEDEIAGWQDRLLKNKQILKAFQDKRGITVETIRELNIGWDGYRYTFPIYDAEDNLLNVRRYKMDAGSANDKMINIPGHGAAQIYGLEDLEAKDVIVMTEGETDRALLWQILRNTDGAKHVGVITHTAGAKTFRQAWASLFAGKVVYIGYDNDDAGKAGAIKAARILAPFVESVYRLDVPLDFPGADWTDYLHKEGYSGADFLKLMDSASPAATSRRQDGPIEESGKIVALQDTTAEVNQGEVLEFTASISGRQIEPYAGTKSLTLECTMDKGVACQMCPLAHNNGEMALEIPVNEKALFRFVDAGEERRIKIIRELSGIRCTDRVSLRDEIYHTIEELVVQPSVDDRSDLESQRPTTRTIFSVGTHNSGVNDKVRIVGRNVIDPRTSKVRFMSWVNEKVDLDIDNFKLTEDQIEQLQAFQCNDEQTPLDKCLEIAADMADNVTHIYGRDLLHVGYDLVWHSPLTFRINDMTVTKGWLEMMVAGDTRTGKSEVATRLIKHYNAGAITSCEGASFAGIVGGVQQIDGRWHLTWGIVPMNDRRLVVLDEASGARDNNFIEQMSSVRSSGVAQISKIANESTSARTRLIWITNPKDGSMLRDSPDVGMAALRSVVPNNEDIARFDFVMSAAKDEVPDDRINSTFQTMHHPAYSSELCELLIKWVWSLGRDDVYISPRAAKAAIRHASALGKRYVADPPLIQSENVRFKILRIACALAGRTFSHKNGKLVVNLEHVNDAVRFLDEIYSSESMGYARKSRRMIRSRERALKFKGEMVHWLTVDEPAVLDTLVAVGGSTFRMRDFEEFGAMDRDAARAAVTRLIQKKMVQRRPKGEMRMEPILIQILREMEDDDDI